MALINFSRIELLNNDSRIFIRNVRQSSTLVHFNLVMVQTKKLHQLPNAIDAFRCTRLEPKHRPARIKILWRIRKIVIEPSQELSQLL